MELGYYVWIAGPPGQAVWVRERLVDDDHTEIDIAIGDNPETAKPEMTIEQTEELIERLQTAVEKARSLLKEN